MNIDSGEIKVRPTETILAQVGRMRKENQVARLQAYATALESTVRRAYKGSPTAEFLIHNAQTAAELKDGDL